MPIVRTTINPGEDIDVSPYEAEVMGRMGLLVPAVTPSDTPTPTAPKGADKPLEG